MTRRHGWTLLSAGALLLAGVVTSRELGASVGGETFVPPRLLSETGLYADTAALAVDAANRPFAPQYPLWSDGAAKRRWIRLPTDSTIDTRDVDRWDFPVGTRFWKEFAVGGRRVETRMLVKSRTDHWEFASYVWAQDQRDAVLAPAAGLSRVAEVAPGKWHRVPSHDECRACHDSDRTEILGFAAVQLSTDRDPLAPHAEPVTAAMVTLRTLADEGRLSPARPEWASTPPRVSARNPLERAVLGYLSTNCGSCHNKKSSLASLGLWLKHEAGVAGTCIPDAVATTVNRPGHWVVPGAPEGTSRLVSPGKPEWSAVLTRAQSRRPSSQMPPIGTVVADREALNLMSTWIAAAPVADPTSCKPR